MLDEPDPGQAYAGPLAVLVDRTSASASEIFAGAIQDYHRGLIIGQTSFGKGTVQSVIPLDRWSSKPTEGQLTVTIGKFYRVTGESTQLRGVTPDIAVALGRSARRTSARACSSTPCRGIASRRYRSARCPRKARWCRRWQREQNDRATHNADYQWLLASLSSIDASRQEKTLSLNLKKRQAERTAQDQARLTQENARRQADGLPAVKSVEDIDVADEPDVILAQAADIMADGVAAKSGARPRLRWRSSRTDAGRPLARLALPQQHAVDLPDIVGSVHREPSKAAAEAVGRRHGVARRSRYFASSPSRSERCLISADRFARCCEQHACARDLAPSSLRSARDHRNHRAAARADRRPRAPAPPGSVGAQAIAHASAHSRWPPD